MANFISDLFQQPESTLLLAVLMLALLSFALRWAIARWQQLPVEEDKKFQQPFRNEE